MKTSVPEPKKKSNKVVSKTLAALLNGEFLTKQGVVAHFPFLLFLTAIFLFNIGWVYHFENTEREIMRTQKALEELKSEYNSIISKLETQERQSQVARDIQNTGLRESTAPYGIIEVEQGYFSED